MASYSSPTILLLLLLIITIFSTAVIADGKKNEKTTRNRFYLHDQVSGAKATALEVVQGPSGQGLLNFGDVVVIDDVLTEAPRPSSKLVGRAQGIFSYASLAGEPALLMAMNFVFSTGKYNGSTLAVLARNPVAQKVRELPVVGGTGHFRLARGYVLTSTLMYNFTTGDTINRYDVYVLHY